MESILQTMICTLQILSAKIDTLQNDLSLVKSKLEPMEGNTVNSVTIRVPTARPAVFDHPKNEDNTKKRLVVKDIKTIISSQQPDLEEEDVSKLYGKIKAGADAFWVEYLEKVEKIEDGLSYRNVPHSEMRVVKSVLHQLGATGGVDLTLCVRDWAVKHILPDSLVCSAPTAITANTTSTAFIAPTTTIVVSPATSIEPMLIMEDPTQFEGLEKWDDSSDEGKKSRFNSVTPTLSL
ncbi:unnamed protein product [Rhizopus stolonifer]